MAMPWLVRRAVHWEARWPVTQRWRKSDQINFPSKIPSDSLPMILAFRDVGIAAEQGRKAFDLTGDAVALTPGSPRIGVFSSPNRRYFNGDPGAQRTSRSEGEFHRCSRSRLLPRKPFFLSLAWRTLGFARSFSDKKLGGHRT